MVYLNEMEYIEAYGYFLVDEAFNARQMYLELYELMPEVSLTEAEIMVLNEAALDNLKNFVITIGKRISEAIARFVDRISQLTEVDTKWLQENKTIILGEGVVNGATFNNLYKYTNIAQVANTKIVDPCNQTILEANKEKWTDEEGYASTNADFGITGFRYNANGDSLQNQLQKFFRGDKEDNVNSNRLNQEERTRYFQYCTQIFPAAKTTINAEKDALKQVANDLESYIATKRSQQNVPPQPSDVTTTQTTQTTQQTVASGTTGTNTASANASFVFGTEDSFFNEVDIKQVKDQDTDGAGPKPNNAVGNNVDTKVNPEKKNKEEITQISRAVRTYYKINSKKLSAKMNISLEAYKSRLKLLKWYVRASQKDKGKNTQTVENNAPQNANQQNNTSMASAFN